MILLVDRQKKIAKDIEVKTYLYSYTNVFPCCCTLNNVEKGISFSWAMNLTTFAWINFAQHYINQKISNKLSNLSLIFISTALPLDSYDLDCIREMKKEACRKGFHNA